jgi:cytochrome c-type biogenesis protein
VGPTLGRLLNPLNGSGVQRGSLLVVYGVGLLAPFVLVALVALAVRPVADWLAAHRVQLARVGAVLLAILGVCMAAGWYRHVASWLARYVPSGT